MTPLLTTFIIPNPILFFNQFWFTLYEKSAFLIRTIGKNSQFLQIGTGGNWLFFITPLPPAAFADVRRHLPCGKAGEKRKSASSCTDWAFPLCRPVSGSRQIPAAGCFYHKISLGGKGCPTASRLRLAPCHWSISWWTKSCSRESCGNLEN